MNRFLTPGIVLALGLVTAGCENFLTGTGLTENPNNPLTARAEQELIAIQANMATRLEGQIARNASIFTQQIIGTNNQQLTYGTQYGITEADIGQNFTAFYTSGGLLAMRHVQEYGAQNDKFMEGVAKIWEGLAFGVAASVWGDLPYSEALNPEIPTPKLDSQESIYAAIQTRLDEGIAALQAAPTTGSCEPHDVIYCATPVTRAVQIQRWIAAARTMKARFYMHLVERNGNAAAQLALAQARQGILEAPANATQAIHGQAPGDFRTFHGQTLDVDANIWYEFLTARGGDIRAGHTLVQLLKDRNDPRLTAYFSPNPQGNIWGVNQNAAIVGAPAGQAAAEINIPVRRAPDFRQPIVTWAENQLIMAEAKFRLGDVTGGTPLDHVNNVRTAVGLAPLTSVTLTDIMLEKYIAMFQNIEVWNDYKRTCVPTLARYQNATEIPGRLPYGAAERTNNPNIPRPSEYPARTTGSSPLRNWNDPTPCP